MAEGERPSFTERLADPAGFLRDILPAAGEGGDALPERTVVQPVELTPPDLGKITQPEADEPEPAKTIAPAIGPEGEDVTGQGPPRRPTTPGVARPATAPLGKVVGTLEPGLPPVKDALLRALQQRQRDALKAQALNELKTVGIPHAAALRNLEFIAQESTERLQNLVTTEIPKWRAAREQLNRDVDEARQMRVNPYNFMQSVGRAGRVTSAISVAVGQLAAGAGNPNSVHKMIKSAIERDIAAQRDNINLAFKGIETKDRLIDKDIDLLDRQFMFEAQARAVAATAVAAQLGAAKQEAANESQRIAIEMLETNFVAESLVQKGIADAQAFSVLIDKKFATEAQALQLQRQVARIREGVAAKGPVPQDLTLPELPFQQRAREAATELDLGAPAPGAPPTAAPPTAEAEPAAAPVAQRTRAGQAAARRPPGRETTMVVGPIQVGDEIVPVEEAPIGSTPPDTATAQTVQPVSEEQVRGMLQRWVPENILARGGYGRAKAIDDNRPFYGPGLTDGIIALGNNGRLPDGTVFRGFEDPNDAIAAANLLHSGLFRPQRDQFENEADFNDAIAHHQYKADNPELLEARIGGFPGNRIRIGQNRELRIAMGSDARTDAKVRREIQGIAESNLNNLEKLHNQALAVQEIGFGSVLGVQITTDGVTFTPFDPEVAADKALQQNRFLDLGIAYIKGKDPSGRLTEQDVKVGRAYFTQAQSLGATAWDTMQTIISKALDRPISQNEARQRMNRFLQAVAVEASRDTLSSIGGDIVLPYESFKQNRAIQNKYIQWMRSEDAQVTEE